MDKYDLNAFDMDGTLLNSRNTVSESSKEAIEKAIDSGKKVVICTGRAVKAVELYKENDLQNVRYYVCENGALLYNSTEKVIMSVTVIPENLVSEIIDLIVERDCVVIARLPIAMGNARECVKDICKVTVADNDHGGCAEAIWKYLLRGAPSEGAYNFKGLWN